MSARGSELDESNLELLLDTICNTFGGILFISILVIILLNITSEEVATESPNPDAQAKLAQMQQELAQTSAELDTLRTAVEQQADIIAQVVDPKAKELLTDWQRVQMQRLHLMQTQNETLDDISQTQQDINEMAERVQNMEKAQAALAALQQQLKREVQVRSQTAKLPKVRQTSKVQVACYVRNGRLCTHAKRGPDGGLVINAAESVERTAADGRKYIEPVVASGLAVDPQGNSSSAIANKLAQFDPNLHYLKVFVWPDSFEHFNAVKDVMVRNQFEYNLVPIGDDKKIWRVRESIALSLQIRFGSSSEYHPRNSGDILHSQVIEDHHSDSIAGN